jgi:hypothetical protein
MRGDAKQPACLAGTVGDLAVGAIVKMSMVRCTRIIAMRCSIGAVLVTALL